MWILLSCLLGLFLWTANASASVAVTQILGGASDSFIPPPPPCGTFGFSEEATQTLPTGFNGGVMLRVMKSRYNHLGYALTDDGVTQRLAVFRLDTLIIVASATITPSCAVYRCPGRLQGDIDTDAKLYLFREAIDGGGVCAAGTGNCIAFSKWLPSATLEAEAITANNQTDNIDDARDDTTGFYLMVNAAHGSANREFRLFNKSGLGQISVGTSYGTTLPIHLSRSFDGHIYAIQRAVSATAGRRIPQGTSTANATFSVTASIGNNLAGAIYGLRSLGIDYAAIEGDTSVTAQAQRAFVRESDLVNVATNSYAVGGTDGAAISGGTFYDSINNRVFSARFRSSDGTRRLVRTITEFLTVEQNYICTACNYNSGSIPGTQIIDYAPQNMRLYTVSTASPAVITKIKVCATGGPPA